MVVVVVEAAVTVEVRYPQSGPIFPPRPPPPTPPPLPPSPPP